MERRCCCPREFHAAFADTGVVALRQRFDKLVCLRGFRGLDDRLAVGLEPAVADVLGDSTVEEERRLGDVADMLAGFRD